MAAFKNVMLVGAGGFLGSKILKALLEEPSLNVTVLARESSKAELDPSLKVIKIADSYPTEALVEAFRGQDAVVNPASALAIGDQFRLIDAAIAAGVRRFVPSEFGLNNGNASARAASFVFDGKAAVRDYLIGKAAEGKIEWTSFSVGSWLGFNAANDFLGFSTKDRRFRVYDDGEGRTSYTTEENTARAVARSLLAGGGADETRNRSVLLSDFAASQNEVLAEVERQTGQKWAVDRIESAPLLAQKQKEAAAGDFGAIYAVVEIALATGKFGGHLEEEGDEILNAKLGLPKVTLEEAVGRALKGAGVI